VLRLEDFMEIQGLYQQGLGVSEIARRLGIDRKTVRKYLRQPPQPYSRAARTQKIDAYRAYLRERWEQGVTNAYQLFREIVKRGYAGGVTQVGHLVKPWRSEGQERAFVRFETAPGEQSQMDWGHFGNWSGSRLYAFALTLCYSRMRYVEFTQRQDSETLLNCLVHAFHYFGGVTASLLTDNMKTVVLERVEGQPQWNPRFLDFAAYYGFVPRVCHPYRPQTKGKIESTIRYIRTSLWPGIRFESLSGLNRQAFMWCEEANRRVHSTTREVPVDRWPHEHLLPIAGRPDYDTSYRSQRQVTKDCLLSYRGNRYSVPHAYARKMVTVCEALDSGVIRICNQHKRIAEHQLARGRGEMIIEPAHYGTLPRRNRQHVAVIKSAPVELIPGPGVGLHHAVPEVESRSLSVYEEVAHVAAI
jgi:transposase